MTDLIFGPVYNWCRTLWSSMADLADQIDDLICSFEGGGDSAMDTLAMLVFGWIVLLLIVVAVVKYVYKRFRKSVPSEAKTDSVAAAVAVKSAEAPAAVSDDKVEVKKAAAAVVSSAKPVVRTGGGGGGRGVTPTPPLRKRLTVGKGSRPEVRTASAGGVPPPTATGPDAEAVRWVNALFSWLYTDVSALDGIVNVWIQTLNNLAKKSVEEHGVGVEVVKLLPETHAPNISNVFAECASNDDITITCDCDATPALQVKALRQKGEKVQVSHYRLNVNRFRARMTAVCVTDKSLVNLKCDGWPDIKVALAPVGSIKSNLDEQSLQEVIGDILITCIRGAHVEFNLAMFPTCPPFSRYVPPPAHILPVHYDSMAEEMAAKSRIHPVPPESQKLGDKRLLVKVLHARGLAPGTQDPYCVVEMDEPPQKNQTCVKKGSDSPIWDEHFLFDVNSGTGELLLEVHDRATKRFLGLGLVGMEELLINPNQRQTITLQPRPYETDPVAGTLTVEFMFIDGTEIPQQGKPYKLKETLRSVTPSGNVLTTTTTVYKAPSAENLRNGENVADSALRDMQFRNTTQPPNVTASPASKTTLIIHSVQRQASIRGEPSRVKVQKTEDGTWQEVPAAKPGVKDSEAQNSDATGQTTGLDQNPSRSRRRKRDFFGTIKRRLERSRGRSKSVGPGDEDMGADTLTRSISADRVRDASAHSTGFIVPSLRVTDGEMSRRSSLSDMSGISGASTRTYVHEASTLVLETNENGINKHYLIPLSLAQKSKWRKRGTKLHIFNDHTFIARHLPAKTTCQICATLIPGRFGKQGYECRDCLIKCHKACHVKADHTCPQSTIQSIELTKMTSPLLDKKLLPPMSPRTRTPTNGHTK